jgi:hypothetical protein
MFTLAIDKEGLTQKLIEEFAVGIEKLRPQKRSNNRLAAVSNGRVVRAAISAGWFTEDSPKESDVAKLTPRQVRDASEMIDGLYSEHLSLPVDISDFPFAFDPKGMKQLHVEEFAAEYDNFAEKHDSSLSSVDMGINLRAAIAAGWFVGIGDPSVVDTIQHVKVRKLADEVENLYKLAVMIDPN